MQTKRFFTRTIILTLTLWVLVLFANTYSSGVSKLKLNRTKISMYVGQSVKLKANVKRKAKKVWKSSNKRIATVNKKGRVKAKKSGTATITVKANRKRVKCRIKVGKYAKSIITNNSDVIIIELGDTEFIKAKIIPSKVLYQGVNFTSHSPKIVSVDQNGKLTGLSRGVTTVTIKSNSITKGKKVLKRDVTVSVIRKTKVPQPSNKPGDSASPKPSDNTGNTSSPTPSNNPSIMPSSSPNITSIPLVIPGGNSVVSSTGKTLYEELAVIEQAELQKQTDKLVVATYVVQYNGYPYTYFFLNPYYSGNMSMSFEGTNFMSSRSVANVFNIMETQFGSATYMDCYGIHTLPEGYKKGDRVWWSIENLDTEKLYHLVAWTNDSTFFTPCYVILMTGDMTNIVNLQ